MKIHLEGMGLIGSLMAWRLARAGVEFTWHDIDAPHTAWKACTGACYPAGDVDSLDWWCYKKWEVWYDSGEFPVDGLLGRSPYVVDTVNKSLPHGLKDVDYIRVGSLRVVAVPSLHINAQRFVRACRFSWAEQRRDEPPAGALVIVSHSFSKRLERYLWGWTRLVRLKYNIGELGSRASFYLRKNRFQFAYCYPSPGSEWWYAGSNLISQNKPHSLDIERKYRGWKARFHELTDGAVQVVEEGAMFEGWRPARVGSLSALEGHAGRERQDNWLLVSPAQRRIYIPPMTSNGFRHFPELWRQVEKVLAL